MKIMLALISAVTTFSAISAQAKVTVPDCWGDSGREVVPGEYIVGIDTVAISKEDLVKVLDGLDGGHITPKAYPMVFTNSLYVLVSARGAKSGTKIPLPKEIRSQVEAELEAIAQIPGISSIDCNGISHPQPAIGVRN